MNKYDLIRKKRDEMRNRRLDRINRRTFPPNRYQIDLAQEAELIVVLPITEEMIINDTTSSDEIQIVEPIIEVPVIITEDNTAPIECVAMISHEMLAQADDIRKLILLQETIKRFSKKKI